jgi:hypothetical protein
MNKHVYRPPSVWITQVLLVVPLTQLLVVLPLMLFHCSSAKPPFNCSSPSTISALLTGFSTLAIIFLIFWGLQKGKHYGKWLAVTLLLGGMVKEIADSRSLQLIYHSVIRWQPLPTPPYECWEKEVLLSNVRFSCGYESYG